MEYKCPRNKTRKPVIGPSGKRVRAALEYTHIIPCECELVTIQSHMLLLVAHMECCAFTRNTTEHGEAKSRAPRMPSENDLILMSIESKEACKCHLVCRSRIPCKSNAQKVSEDRYETIENELLQTRVSLRQLHRQLAKHCSNITCKIT
eukprot:1628521-Pleurochrysis_carterae.AAC.7